MRDIRIQHIVVATDLSRAASAAYPYAASFARAFEAKLTLLYVDELSSFSLRTSEQVNEYLNRVSEHQRAQLGAARQWFAALEHTGSCATPGLPRAGLRRDHPGWTRSGICYV